MEPPPPVSWEEAEAAARSYPWFTGHPFPGCFVCGPDRAVGDGLRIFPGAAPDARPVAAAPWVPDATTADASGKVREEIVWAALDCPTWFGSFCFEPWEGGALLGRLAARVFARPAAGERCIAYGWALSREGRKVHAASALRSADGTLYAVARATWIGLKR